MVIVVGIAVAGCGSSGSFGHYWIEQERIVRLTEDRSHIEGIVNDDVKLASKFQEECVVELDRAGNGLGITVLERQYRKYEDAADDYLDDM